VLLNLYTTKYSVFPYILQGGIFSFLHQIRQIFCHQRDGEIENKLKKILTIFR